MITLYIEHLTAPPGKPSTILVHRARSTDAYAKSCQLETKVPALPADTYKTLDKVPGHYSLSRVEAVYAGIASFDSSLAQKIPGLARNFDFKTILNLISK